MTNKKQVNDTNNKNTNNKNYLKRMIDTVRKDLASRPKEWSDVKSESDGQLTIRIEGNTFKLTSFKDKKGKSAFFKYLAQNKDFPLYLKVYPKFNLSTGEISFRVVNWKREKPANYQVNQFLLAGTWQLLPQFKASPVMTIYRNTLRPWEDPTKVKYNHFPVTGFTEPPFKFNSKNPDADERKFYELLTQFNPQNQEFQFQFLVDSCSSLPPRVKKVQPNANSKKNKLNKQGAAKTSEVEQGDKTKELVTVS